MPMRRRIAMTAEADGRPAEIPPLALSRLLTWLSPAFPVGSFAFSHGLEAAVEAGLVTSGDDLRRWIAVILGQGAAASDAVFLCHAWRAVAAGGAGLGEVAELAAAFRASAELAIETEAQGAAFVKAIRAGWPRLAVAAHIDGGSVPPTYPVAVGAVGAAAGLPLQPLTVAYLQAFAGNLVAAGVKLIPLGQSEGLRVLVVLEPVVLACAAAAGFVALADVGGAAWMADWTAVRHETQYSRLFRS
jgi:urease accessory protein